MKKIIMILMLIAVCLNAQDDDAAVDAAAAAAAAVSGAVVDAISGDKTVLRPFVKLNIKYKGKIYKNYECQVIEVKDNKVLILSKKNKLIWVELGKSSREIALNAIADTQEIFNKYEQQLKLKKLLKQNTKVVAGLKMYQNGGKEGCLVNYYYWKNIVIPNQKSGPTFYKSALSNKQIYLIESFNIADGISFNMSNFDKAKDIPGYKYSEYVLYKIGLFRYTNALHQMVTVEKYTTKYSVYKEYMKTKTKE